MSEAPPLSDKEFARLMVEMHSFLRNYAKGPLRMQLSDAEDLVQDTMYLAWRARQQFKPGTDFKSWVFTILRNKRWTDARRWKVAQMYQVQIDESGKDIDVPISGGQEESVELSDVLRAMSALPLEQADSLILFARGHSHADMAAEQGIAVGTVKSRVHRARAAIKEKCR